MYLFPHEVKLVRPIARASILSVSGTLCYTAADSVDERDPQRADAVFIKA